MRYEQSQTEIIHSEEALQKDLHTCLEERCVPKISLRQSVRINTIPYVEDKIIEYYQSLYFPHDKDNPNSTLSKYWYRITYIALKSYSLGVAFDKNKPIVFGTLIDKYYNFVGDLTQYNILAKNYGLSLQTKPYVMPWTLLEDKSFGIELPQRKSLLQQFYPWIKFFNDAFDNLRINLDNSARKYYLVVGNDDPDWRIEIETIPSINDAGVVAITWNFLPKHLKDDMATPESREKKLKEFRKRWQQSYEKSLFQNNYADVSTEAWMNMENALKTLCFFSNMKISPEQKKANMLKPEVAKLFYSHDLGENFILRFYRELATYWNKYTNENNEIIKTIDDNENINDQNQDQSNNTKEFINGLLQ